MEVRHDWHTPAIEVLNPLRDENEWKKTKITPTSKG
jgi:hypothetical protein